MISEFLSCCPACFTAGHGIMMVVTEDGDRPPLLFRTSPGRKAKCPYMPWFPPLCIAARTESTYTYAMGSLTTPCVTPSSPSAHRAIRSILSLGSAAVKGPNRLRFQMSYSLLPAHVHVTIALHGYPAGRRRELFIGQSLSCTITPRPQPSSS